jgi:serine/threonine protein kinase
LLFIGGDGSEAKSPHFVRVYEIFGLQNRIYIFVEICSKLLIYTTIKTRDTITLNAKKRAKQMVEAIYTLQLCGIAQRNIRIQNVIFDKDMNIKIVGCRPN